MAGGFLSTENGFQPLDLKAFRRHCDAAFFAAGIAINQSIKSLRLRLRLFLFEDTFDGTDGSSPYVAESFTGLRTMAGPAIPVDTESSGNDAQRYGCSTAVGKLKNGLATG
jgi:hypothetical protein